MIFHLCNAQNARALSSTLFIAIALNFLGTTSRAQTYYPPYGSKTNPFRQPIETTRFYGSGDVNRDGKLDSLDRALMQATSPQIDEADIDGNGVPSQANDLALLDQHLKTGTKLPSDWFNITREERKSWLSKMLAIDKTDTITYRDPDFVSGNFASQLNINFYGMSGYQIRPQANFRYDTAKSGRFNLPLYYTTRRSATGGHGMNAILVGDDPLNWNDWSFVEPQTDWIVQPGSQSIPLNSTVSIHQLHWSYFADLKINSRDEPNIVVFDITNGQPSLDYYDTTYLILDRNYVNQPPGHFTLIAPIDGMNFPHNAINATFLWHKSLDPNTRPLDHVGYDLRIKGFNSGIDTLITGISDTMKTFYLYPYRKGMYEWFVSASDGELATNSDTSTFFISNSLPSRPSFLYPKNNDTITFHSGQFLITYSPSADPDNDTLTYFIGISDQQGGVSPLDTGFFTTSDSLIVHSTMFRRPSRYALGGAVTDGRDTVPFIQERVYFYVTSLTTVERTEESGVPAQYSLNQNYPNPFNPSTYISFSLPSKSFVSLKVFDLIGREVATIVSEEMSAGNHSRQWNGNEMPSGVYFYRLRADAFVETKKLVLLK